MCVQQRVPPVRVLGGGGRGAGRAVAAGGRGVVLAAAARRAARLRGRALPHRQRRAVLPDQPQGTLLLSVLTTTYLFYFIKSIFDNT